MATLRFLRVLGFSLRLLFHILTWELLLRRFHPTRVRRTAPQRYRAWAAAFRELATAQGGALIKLGQFLSARVDLLPDFVTEELARLQDEVPAEPFERIRPLIEAELGQPLESAFRAFDPVATAGASLGQVHRAWLSDGLPVMVKVQRPGIERLLAADLAALTVVARILSLYPPLRRRVHLDRLLQEFARTLAMELDYIAEARHAEQFARNFADDPGIRIPRPFWSHTRRRVLVLEDVTAIKITDIAAIERAGISRTAVARRLYQAYLRQIFYDGFFHADPHPGNLFVEPLDRTAPSENGRAFRLTFVDFGMVGRISPEARRWLREAAIGLGTQDARRIVEAMHALGFLLPDVDLNMLTQAVERLLSRVWGLSMAQLREWSLAEAEALFLEFRELLLRFPFQIPQEFLLLGRTLGILAGLVTRLDPGFNVFREAEPFARRLLEEEQLTLSELVLEALRQMMRIPWDLGRFLEGSLTGEIRWQVAFPEARETLMLISMGFQRLIWQITGLAWWILALLLWANGQERFAWILGGIGALWLLWGLRPWPRRLY
ncbi:AarF/UbiB family protein [Thermoflexus sp.]|uniref:ABC1 kinase family protein n=1 Tax=Thermoflexus sp. TaxID=1969742 RepID=UPI0025D2FE58|nr:AarF/UbiB family protein [Thermoflexus sp.]MCS7352243.1 AarF/UbiB family protein [Thermoflexus sp.]MCX7689842.1 AarF/UbiB family protein [Thermoflexus sp.]MDW8181705.1 AarF/UbiB family protein [Anaerolineae bacterium]